MLSVRVIPFHHVFRFKLEYHHGVVIYLVDDLYNIYTSNMPTDENTLIATIHADDTAIVSSNSDSKIASQNLPY